MTIKYGKIKLVKIMKINSFWANIMEKVRFWVRSLEKATLRQKYKIKLLLAENYENQKRF